MIRLGCSRMEYERKTVAAMVELYCRAHHQPPALCPECRELLAYADQRLAHCRYQDGKPTCGKCPIHCYKPEMRGRIQTVMRYAGPRMLRHHPLLALIHLYHGLRKPPTAGRPPFSGRH